MFERAQHGARRVRADSAAWRERAPLALRALSAPAVIAIALAIEPQSAGFGSHRALGLPPCPFLQLLRVPCATCGLTTAFAELVRGHGSRAIAANVLVVPLALLLLADVVWSIRMVCRCPRVPSPMVRLWPARHALVASVGVVWCARLLGLLAARLH